jgi:hypothetical protein
MQYPGYCATHLSLGAFVASRRSRRNIPTFDEREKGRGFAVPPDQNLLGKIDIKLRLPAWPNSTNS